jgi:hypothetical protein
MLSKEEITELEQILNLKYSTFLKSRLFEIATSTTKEVVKVQVTLKKSDDSFNYPVEAMVDLAKTELKARDAQMLLLDYIDLYFEEFFKEDEMSYLPIDWASYSFCGEEIFLKAQILNLKCEQQADALLAAVEV